MPASGSDEAATKLGEDITAKHPARSLRKVGDLNAEDWAMESFDISKNFVYSLPENSVPSDQYLATAQEISGQRAALAGYRLAELVNKLLK